MLIGALALAFAADALACSCLPVDLVRDLPRAEGAFIGTLLEREDREATSTLLFRVEQVYKGDISNRVEVETPRGGAACGIEVPVGERIGLLLERDGGVWRSTLCSQVEPGGVPRAGRRRGQRVPAAELGRDRGRRADPGRRRVAARPPAAALQSLAVAELRHLGALKGVELPAVGLPAGGAIEALAALVALQHPEDRLA